jgi:hypothetical protein
MMWECGTWLDRGHEDDLPHRKEAEIANLHTGPANASKRYKR